MGDEFRNVDWSFGDIHSLIALYEGVVEEVSFELSETALHCIYYMGYYRAIKRGMCHCS